MKKAENSKSKEPDDMLTEYRFDYTKARPNRFAAQEEKDRISVALDPDVAEVFTNSESVNKVLRALIATMPETSLRNKACKPAPRNRA